jgi:hypothetical protein
MPMAGREGLGAMSVFFLAFLDFVSTWIAKIIHKNMKVTSFIKVDLKIKL